MYSYSGFAKLIIVIVAIVVIYLIIKRIQNKRKEDFEDKDN